MVLMFLALVACSDTGGGATSATTTTERKAPVCLAINQLAQVQSDDNPQRLLALSRSDLIRNFDEQRNAQLAVLEVAPSAVAADYERVIVADDVIKGLVLQEWGETGSTSAKDRATAAGYQSVAEYASRGGIRLADGSTRSWAEYIAMRDATFVRLMEGC